MILFKDEISLSLAVEDYLPVLLFAAGLFFVAKMVSATNRAAGKLAFVGGILITLGGLLKASWKLVQALGGDDFPVLNNSLFVFMSAGFICLAWAFLKRNSTESDFFKISRLPLALILLFWSIAFYLSFFKESRAWFFILLGATTIANLALLLQLIIHSFLNKLHLAAVLFLVNLVCIFVLARSSDQTVTFQWIKQFVNTFSQIAFLIGSYYIFNRAKR